ncbi:hypothetical protein C2G38_2081734, partial [Gigaspora rosea]
MEDLDLKTSYNGIILPTAWDIKDKSPFIDIDSSGLKCGYHGDDGYSFYSGSGGPYDYLSCDGNIPGYTTGDIVGCYLKIFKNKIVFYTKNGINLAISKGILYPCVGFISQAMTNEDINKKSKNALILEYQEKVYFIIGDYENMLVSKLYFIMGKYNEAIEDLTRLLEIEPDNTIALKYRGEINYMMKRYNESIADLEKLLRIKPNDIWAKK